MDDTLNSQLGSVDMWWGSIAPRFTGGKRGGAFLSSASVGCWNHTETHTVTLMHQHVK